MLNDADAERRQRKKEAAEVRWLELQNLEKANAVLQQSIQVAKMAGLTDREIREFFYFYIEDSFRALAEYQRRGVIGTATIHQLPPPQPPMEAAAPKRSRTRTKT